MTSPRFRLAWSCALASVAAIGHSQMLNISAHGTLEADILEGSTAVREVSDTFSPPLDSSLNANWAGAGYTATTFIHQSTQSWTPNMIKCTSFGHSTLQGNTGSIVATATSDEGMRIDFTVDHTQDLLITGSRNVTTFSPPFGCSLVFDGSLISQQGQTSWSTQVHLIGNTTHSLSFSLKCDPTGSGSLNFDSTVSATFSIGLVPEPTSAVALGLLGLAGTARARRKRSNYRT